MNTKRAFLILLLFSIHGNSQQEFHVKIEGRPSGDGSVSNPWDLQTALNQPEAIVRPGDTVWLHGGVYKGRFTSRLQSGNESKKITVASYSGQMAILDGHVDSKEVSPVLTVTGANVIYKDFEVSPKNLGTRNKLDHNFIEFTGIYHTSGKNCEFRNLIIHGNNGLGFGSWNKTGGSIIKNCLIYDNGYINERGNGIGEGMYVQNDSDTDVRLISDNIIFNNYYKGIEVWSANKNADREYVKNISLKNNVIFNSGLVANRTVDNIIVATDDRNGINVAKNIVIEDNLLFHKIDFSRNDINGDAPSLTLGFTDNSPAENIKVLNNIVIGRNNPLRILHVDKMLFEGNTVYGGYIHLSNDNFKSDFTENWTYNTNKYFTKNSTPFYIIKKEKYDFNKWKKNFQFDLNSESQNIQKFDLPQVLDVTQFESNRKIFRIVVFDKSQLATIVVDFKEYGLKPDAEYILRDVENYPDIFMQSRLTNSTLSIAINSLTTEKEKKYFGVYLVEFK